MIGGDLFSVCGVSVVNDGVFVFAEASEVIGGGEVMLTGDECSSVLFSFKTPPRSSGFFGKHLNSFLGLMYTHVKSPSV